MQIHKLLLLGVAVASLAHAGFIVEIQQVGSNVVATGSGALNMSALSSSNGGASGSDLVYPNNGLLDLGALLVPLTVFRGAIAGPSSFGNGGVTDASASTGSAVSFFFVFGGGISLPFAYTSGTVLSDSATWNNTTIANLGITPGTYIWTWGTGQNADFIEITTTPEPATLGLVLTGLAAMLWRSKHR